MQIDSSSQVPISLVYRADLHPQGLKGGPFPTILTGGAAANQIESTDVWGRWKRRPRTALEGRGTKMRAVVFRGPLGKMA